VSGRVTCSWVFALIRDGGFGLWLVFVIISSVLGLIGELVVIPLHDSSRR
jgi:hypothetical protein